MLLKMKFKKISCRLQQTATFSVIEALDFGDYRINEIENFVSSTVF